ncbi:hypothetical protein [Niallia sp. Krafla_26]|uniref:hypothetical protein n=1 Tax=Niallia sp. Krafla_26 TaxID=3064703 RepID=UPI003D17BC6A
MGHDIFGFNRAGEEIAYARFSMGNYNSIILYEVLHAEEYYAGVSGSGGSTTFSMQHCEKAMEEFNHLLKINGYSSKSNHRDKLPWDLRQISEFIENCLTTSKKEGKVQVYFG